MITPILKEIGLSNYESKIYLALLELGESTTGDILKKAHLNTGKIYEILDSLVKKGLVSMVVKSKVKHFSPANPERVLDYLAEKRGVMEQQEKEFQKILPELMRKLQKVKTPLKIEVFTGLKGVKTAYKEETKFYNKTNTLHVMGVLSAQHYPKNVYDFFVFTMKPRREATKVRVRKLLGEGSRKSRGDHEKHAEIKYLPYGSLVTINVINDLSIIGIVIENPVTIIIENKEVAQSFQEHFNLLWRIAKS